MMYNKKKFLIWLECGTISSTNSLALHSDRKRSIIRSQQTALKHLKSL